MTSKTSLFHLIGTETIDKAIRLFYERAFADPIIGHFFFNHDHEDLIKKQSQFTRALLGSKEAYQGVPLKTAHSRLPLHINHFRRRQVLMEEVLVELKLEDKLRVQWLKLEERLKPLIINS